MHKSVDVLRLQQEIGGAIGVCCQKVSEAEVFARAGVKDILVSNQVREPAKIDRLARLPRYGARIIVCLDDLANVAELSAVAQRHSTRLECFVEIDCGAGRCGVKTAAEVVAIAKAIDAVPGLNFIGIQAYQGAMQHIEKYEDRKTKLDAAIAQVKEASRGFEKGRVPARARQWGWHGQLLLRERLGGLQRAPMRQLCLHGRRLWPDSRQERQAHRQGRVGKRALYPDQRDEPRKARQGDLRRGA